MLNTFFGRLLGRSGKPQRKKPIRRQASLRLEVLEDRWVPATLSVGPGHTYLHIQDAVDAAHSGDKIKVYSGTYTEQVKITKSNLTLTTTGPDAAIQAPASLTGSMAIIDVIGAKHVTIDDFNLVGNSSTQYGIKVENGASATITNNSIKNITGSGGAGIVVGKSIEGTFGSAVIVNNVVQNYTKAGIVIDNVGSTGAVFNNCVVGQGASASIVQYGIQVSFGANADVECNDVSGNSLQSGADSAGILVIQSGTCTEIEGNYAHNNEFGVFIVSSSSVEISGNWSANNSNDGIQLLGASCNTVTWNVVVSNAGDGISIYGDVPLSQGGFGAANNNVIANNLIANNGGNGVTIDLAAGTLILGNIILDNGTNGVSGDNSGIAVQDGSSHTTIAFNFIDADDGTSAISISNSTQTTTTCNFITH